MHKIISSLFKNTVYRIHPWNFRTNWRQNRKNTTINAFHIIRYTNIWKHITLRFASFYFTSHNSYFHILHSRIFVKQFGKVHDYFRMPRASQIHHTNLHSTKMSKFTTRIIITFVRQYNLIANKTYYFIYFKIDILF